MIHAAIDESGTDGQAELVCVAVVSGTSRQWRLLKEDWCAVLADLPKRYHALDTLFDGPGAPNEILAKLVQRRMDFAGAISIRRSEFEAEVDAQWRSRYATEYSMGVMACVQFLSLSYSTRSKKRRKKPPGIFYHVADGHRNVGSVVNILDDLRKYRSDKYLVAGHELVPGTDLFTHPPDLVSHEIATRGDSQSTPAMAVLQRYVTEVTMSQERIAKTVGWTKRMEQRHKYRQPGSTAPPYDGPVDAP